MLMLNAVSEYSISQIGQSKQAEWYCLCQSKNLVKKLLGQKQSSEVGGKEGMVESHLQLQPSIGEIIASFTY